MGTGEKFPCHTVPTKQHSPVITHQADRKYPAASPMEQRWGDRNTAQTASLGMLPEPVPGITHNWESRFAI